MTSKESKEFYDLVDPETMRHILEGGRIVGHAAKLSVVCIDDQPYFAVDTLRCDGRSKVWERSTRKICRILKNEACRLPPETLTTLAAAAVMPGRQLPLFTVETHMSMLDNGGTQWDVVGYLSSTALLLPGVATAVERSRKRVLKVVTKL